MAVQPVTDDNFKSEVLDSDLPVLVDFWAAWCGPCRMVSPVVEAIAQEYHGRLKTCKMNVDENPYTPSGYRIMSIPTLMVFQGGRMVLNLVGFRPKEMITAELDQVL